MSGTLAISVQKIFAEGNADAGALADVLPVSDKGTMHRAVVIPVGRSDVVTRLSVRAGRYLVRAYLPSGHLLQQHVSVAPGETVPVTLRGEQSAHEWLGWHTLVDDRQVTAPSETEGHAPAEVLLVDDTGPLWATGWLSALHERRVSDVTLFVAARPRTRLAPLRMDEIRSSYRFDLRNGHDLFTPFESPFQDPLPSPSAMPFVIVRRRDRLDVVRVGAPWLVHPGEPAAYDLLVPHDYREPVSLVVADPLLGALLGYMAAGRLPAARAFLRRDSAPYQQLHYAAYKKRLNPFAAAAALCLLLQMRANLRDEAPWFTWIDNLAKWFPWLPDAAILKATLLLRRARSRREVVQAGEWYCRASDSGLPLFTANLRLLYDGVATLVDDPAIDEQPLADRLRIVEPLMRVIAPDQIFTTLQLRGNE